MGSLNEHLFLIEGQQTLIFLLSGIGGCTIKHTLHASFMS